MLASFLFSTWRMSLPFFFKYFYQSIVALQCCVSFYCTAKRISHTYTYIHIWRMSFSFARAEGQVSELPAVCGGPRCVSKPGATATVSVVFPLWGLHPLLLLRPSPVSCSTLLALRRHLFMSLRNKPSHVLFLVGLKCPTKEKFQKKGVGHCPNTQGDHGGLGTGSHWREVRATLLRPHGQ